VGSDGSGAGGGSAGQPAERATSDGVLPSDPTHWYRVGGRARRQAAAPAADPAQLPRASITALVCEGRAKRPDQAYPQPDQAYRSRTARAEGGTGGV